MTLPFQSAAVSARASWGGCWRSRWRRPAARSRCSKQAVPMPKARPRAWPRPMLAPLAESAVAPVSVVRMGQHALSRWPELLASLVQPVFFQREGTLVLWHRQDSAEAARLRACWLRPARRCPNSRRCRRSTQQPSPRWSPRWASASRKGLFLPGEGQLDNRALLASLLATLQASANVSAALAIASRTGRLFAWHTGAARLGDRLPGPWCPPQWNALRGVRGEVIRVHAPEVTLQRPTRLVHPRYPLYIAPKPGNLFVIGATEIESDDMSPASVRSTLELLSAAYAVHSGFAEARIVEIATQCRPTLPDNLPAIRQPQPRVLQINGLYRHGFMIAPALLDAAMELLAHGHSALARSFGMATSDNA
jgi:glycine oxidase